MLLRSKFALVDDYGRCDGWLWNSSATVSSDTDTVDALKTLINDEDDQVRYSAKTVLARIDVAR